MSQLGKKYLRDRKEPHTTGTPMTRNWQSSSKTNSVTKCRAGLKGKTSEEEKAKRAKKRSFIR